VRRALQRLFEAPIDPDNTLARAVVQSVLGPGPIDFSRKVLDFAANDALRRLVTGSVPPVVWENEEMPNRKSVLERVETSDQETLLLWIGAYLF
jgi:hypothetical protein